MKMKFNYSLISDLVFHVLAFMQVSHAPNLYSKKYIETFPRSMRSDLLNKTAKIENYYNENFDRLCVINFLPIYCNSLESFKKRLFSYEKFSDEDIQNFINPFIAILEEEIPKYTVFWNCKMQQLSLEKGKWEKYISDCFNNYQKIFDYFGKNAEVCFSLSLTCNGRGIYSENSFTAIVPYPFTQKDWEACFFQIFHEYTHQFTDRLLNTDISMTDASHELSEKLVISADYFIFKKTDTETAKNYLRWIAKNSGRENEPIEETTFLNVFQIPTELMNSLNEEIKKFY